MIKDTYWKSPTYFPLSVSADYPPGASPTGVKMEMILSGTDDNAFQASYIQIYAGGTNGGLKDLDCMVYLDGWVNDAHPYTNLTNDWHGASNLSAVVGTVGQTPYTILVPAPFSLSSISVRFNDTDVKEVYLTYGNPVDRNNRADNTLAQNQNL
jgi:hypothetical protein